MPTATTTLSHKKHTPSIAKQPKRNTKANKQTMKFIQMIAAALAGTVADWDNWGKSLSSSLFFQNKNTKRVVEKKCVHTCGQVCFFRVTP
jgi:hypothetical protein